MVNNRMGTGGHLDRLQSCKLCHVTSIYLNLHVHVHVHVHVVHTFQIPFGISLSIQISFFPR